MKPGERSFPRDLLPDRLTSTRDRTSTATRSSRRRWAAPVPETDRPVGCPVASPVGLGGACMRSSTCIARRLTARGCARSSPVHRLRRRGDARASPSSSSPATPRARCSPPVPTCTPTRRCARGRSSRSPGSRTSGTAPHRRRGADRPGSRGAGHGRLRRGRARARLGTGAGRDPRGARPRHCSTPRRRRATPRRASARWTRWGASAPRRRWSAWSSLLGASARGQRARGRRPAGLGPAGARRHRPRRCRPRQGQGPRRGAPRLERLATASSRPLAGPGSTRSGR